MCIQRRRSITYTFNKRDVEANRQRKKESEGGRGKGEVRKPTWYTENAICVMFNNSCYYTKCCLHCHHSRVPTTTNTINNTQKNTNIEEKKNIWIYDGKLNPSIEWWYSRNQNWKCSGIFAIDEKLLTKGCWVCWGRNEMLIGLTVYTIWRYQFGLCCHLIYNNILSLFHLFNIFIISVVCGLWHIRIMCHTLSHSRSRKFVFPFSIFVVENILLSTHQLISVAETMKIWMKQRN